MASSTEQIETEYFLMPEGNCSAAMSDNHANGPTESTHTPAANPVTMVEKPIRGLLPHTTVNDSSDGTENMIHREPQLPRELAETGAKLGEVRALPAADCELRVRGKQGDGSNPDKPTIEFTRGGWQRESKVHFKEQTDTDG